MGPFPETGSTRLESMTCYGPGFPFLPANIRDHGADAAHRRLLPEFRSMR
jgi:hypothetical protein